MAETYPMKEVISTEFNIVMPMLNYLNIICPQQYIYLFVKYGNHKNTEDMVMTYYKCSYIVELITTHTRFSFHMSLHMEAISYSIVVNDFVECKKMKALFGLYYDMSELCDDVIYVIDVIAQARVQNLTNVVFKRYSDIRYMSCSMYM